MAEIVDGLVSGVVRQADNGAGRRRSGKSVTRDEKAGDWPADEARHDQAESRGRDSDFERIGEPPSAR